MKQKNQQTTITNKIKKWIQTAKEAETARFAVPITRLTSIKSFCTNKTATQQFALYIAKRIQEQMNQDGRPEHFSESEWSQQSQLMNEAIALMEIYLENSTYETQQSFRRLLKEIDSLQGDDYRIFCWTTVRFVVSGNLLNLEYALRCFVEEDFPYWAYKLAKEYVERYASQYGTGITPESIPMLLEIAEFWCQHYFSESLTQKFPQLMLNK
ncbi:hypothetical protein H6S82_07495 [Planktothrix sp. FACHB-1355]|uniref:Uncharacterized protein n=1 Tax=Aerosakkonema funiforme FACHB-1375 TaxID=2949571 RepID=A0A926VDU4_9CYAN|nr:MULTISPECIES: hypothetical protein [Oscillatoriales]MBD2181047.1 hypothetical protein [Aerosakkonema funiforme FACHB-1375]MBD3558698.1 hypothetical protein [Planktothrix sp. FACHB-1355]